MRRDKSFADDLIVHRGVVSGRVALLLRSAETKPYRCLDLFDDIEPSSPIDQQVAHVLSSGEEVNGRIEAGSVSSHHLRLVGGSPTSHRTQKMIPLGESPSRWLM